MIQKKELLFHDTFIIFGTGNTGKKVDKILKGLGKKIYCFLVSNNMTQRESASENEVISLNDTDRIDNKNIPVIIAVFNREKNSNLSAIIAQLEQKGFTFIITYFEFHAIFADELGDCFWLTKQSYYLENQAKYKECLSLFEEQQSRQLYNQIIGFLESFNPFLLSEPDMDHQYFPEDLTIWDGTNAFIDAGAYDGQNILDATEKFGLLSKVIAFEPDLDNFKKIDQLISWPSVTKEAVLYPCGVWSETLALHFHSGAGESAAVSEHGNIVIPVVSLDEALKGIVPGFIKMDIEGAEIEALKGAKVLISKHKPTLAICIYHTPSHLYEIPLLLKTWNLGYKFYLRFHGHNLFETVLYCII